jgi:hypothetical protein
MMYHDIKLHGMLQEQEGCGGLQHGGRDQQTKICQ